MRLRALKPWQKMVLAVALLGGLAPTLQFLGVTPQFARGSSDGPTTSEDAESYVSTVFVLSVGACKQRIGVEGEHQILSADVYDAAAKAIEDQFRSAEQSPNGPKVKYTVLRSQDLYAKAKEESDCTEAALTEAADNEREAEVDVVVLYDVKADRVDDGDFHWTVKADAVSGHSVKVNLGYEEDFRTLDVSPQTCGLACLGDVAELAGDVGHVLEIVIAGPVAFTITYENLLESNFYALTNRVSELPINYVHSDSTSFSTVEHYFFYQTVSGNWEFSAQASAASLEKTLRELKAFGVNLSKRGRKLELKRVFPPLSGVVSILAALILIVAVPMALAVARHHQVLIGHVRDGESSEGLRQLENGRRHWLIRFAPKPRAWRHYEKTFKEDQLALVDARRQRRQKDIDQAWREDRPYRAIAITDELLAELEGLPDLQSVRDELLAKRIGTFAGPQLATLLAGQTSLEVHVGQQVNIGRDNHKEREARGILLSYNRISRLGRQCQLEASSGGVGVADLNSTNGTWLDDQEIAPGDFAFIKPKGAVLALGGERRTPPRRGYCRLQLTPTGRRALFARLDEASMDFFDPIRLGAEWPNLEREQNIRWLCLFPGGHADVHLGADQSLVALPATQTPLFRLYYGDGLLVGPPEGAETLIVDGEAVRAPVPWRPGARVQAEDHEYELHEGRMS